MSDACPKCPCPDVCIRKPGWCEMAAEEPPDPIGTRSICERSRIERAKAAYPPLLEQGGNVLAAAGRILGAIARGEPVKVPRPVYYDRLAICRECEFNGERPAGVRCTKCGCGGLKLELATELCPLDPPKWGPFTGAPPAPAAGDMTGHT